MDKSYAILMWIVIFLVLFLYFSYFSVSLRIMKNKDLGIETSSEKKTKALWKVKNLVDAKNQSLGWLDLGNHILIAGIILLAIFIIKNA